jgi:hypothetical protein
MESIERVSTLVTYAGRESIDADRSAMAGEGEGHD